MEESTGKLTLLHTNDIHSHLEEAARIAGCVRKLRQDVPERDLLLVDCGDFLDRVRLETEGTQGKANIRLLAELAYDAVAMGNNEGLSYTRPELDELFARVPFPVLCANLTVASDGSRPGWLSPAAVIEKAGLRIALLGLTAPFREFYELLGWQVEDPLQTAKRWVRKLREEADVVILLSHLGLRQDERLASAIEGIDVILGAHTHHLLETPLRIGSTVVCAAGKFGRHLGVVRIEKQPDGSLAVEGCCVPTADIQPDAKTEALLEECRQEALAAMDIPIARLTHSLASETDRESPLGTLLASAIRRATGAEIGLTNAGQLLSGLPAGTATRRDIHAICPSPINPCLIRLKGKFLRRSLEESLLPEFIGLEFQGYGFRGRWLGTLCTDGLEWTVDDSRPPYEKVIEASVGGAPLDDEREYTVGTLDMFTFGIGYLGLKEGTVVRYLLPEFIRDVLAEALNDQEAIADCSRPRRYAAGHTA
ncbi:bifunctional UDP-sugar hydrolase/5'-nucleotidase [Cohnella lubricantis]|uniref:Bifunctional metallophosphatase/5'-nucleotidase n=1 Tax=Cohnella lubricantis TaxID=2163172 RepID=A0A841TF02_9BACL|nr:bifunctional UDP-sugar hydrolase/5'-nucleotidase [Cohnella lubricantis]MBB6677547.1 bifunctional metallophosphatase/5'-nucleotidase [Cohnella lubricantis]MBP2116567.1 2',3'-cyclic-nucleotide 2'-phosphodiesterase (5'-nucleotidase family) [Cohnella lubricantis]